MKTIGLIGGMSWESSLEYYRIINEGVKARLGGLHSAECLMWSFDFAEIEALQMAGDWDAARRIHDRWLPLFLGNFRGGPNPVPAKAALRLMGLIDTQMVRAPLLPMDEAGVAAMDSLLRDLGLVEASGGRIAAEGPDTRREAVA